MSLFVVTFMIKIKKNEKSSKNILQDPNITNFIIKIIFAVTLIPNVHNIHIVVMIYPSIQTLLNCFGANT